MTAFTDVVIRVPQALWLSWLAEGGWPGEEEPGEWAFTVGSLGRTRSDLRAADEVRCYVAAFGHLRGYAPMQRIDRTVGAGGRITDRFVRGGDAVAVTVPGLALGGEPWALRSWELGAEVPFPAWATYGLPFATAISVERLLELRLKPEHRELLRARAIGGARTARELFAGL